MSIPFCTHPTRIIDDEALPFAFLVSTLSKEVVLAAASGEERWRWLEELRCVRRYG